MPLKIFRGLACFSPAVAPTIRETWAKNGGEIARTADEKQNAEVFFCCGLSDRWLLKLSLKPVVVIHADWILASSACSFALPLSRFVLDERYESLKRPRTFAYDSSGTSMSQDTLVNTTATSEDLPLTSTPVSADSRQTQRKRKRDASKPVEDYSSLNPARTVLPDLEFKHPFRSAAAPDTLNSVEPSPSALRPKKARVTSLPVKTVKEVSADGHPFIKGVKPRPNCNPFTLRLPENLWHSLGLDRAPGYPLTATTKSVSQTLSSVSIGRVALFVPGNTHLGREFRCVG